MFHCLPNSARADENLAEVAVQLGKMVEHLNHRQSNPGLRADESPCTNYFVQNFESNKELNKMESNKEPRRLTI